MAVGAEGINKLRGSATLIADYLNNDSTGMKRALITFQYVTDYITNWASDTDIGQDTRETLMQLCQIVGEINTVIEKFEGEIMPRFCNEQSQING